MSKTRVESLVKTIDIINDINNNTCLDPKSAAVILLTEIAGSLAVIADCITAKKDGDAE